MAKDNDLELEATLKPFYARAAEAEERLSRLEAILACKKDAGNEEFANALGELQGELEGVKKELLLEEEKAKKLAAENEKLKYRISHLVQAVREADQELESTRGHKSNATTETALENMRL